MFKLWYQYFIRLDHKELKGPWQKYMTNLLSEMAYIVLATITQLEWFGNAEVLNS